jgi:hypothetical protein
MTNNISGMAQTVSSDRYPRYNGLSMTEALRRWNSDRLENEMVYGERRFWTAVFLPHLIPKHDGESSEDAPDTVPSRRAY